MATYEAVFEPDDVWMIDRFEDGDLGFEVLEQLGRHLGSLDDLDGDDVSSVLFGESKAGAEGRQQSIGSRARRRPEGLAKGEPGLSSGLQDVGER
jgi:hypothetical protein